ncbi:hypothetical protein C8J57DRAFT_1168465 [Mycena rebaudengoi]|nr:hypothetical protein C8J57DRAFT_1168465 [Mycena rebaudengoi]
MSSWYSNWLPGLPSINFALPASIQRRFISFVLKKSLGHLLKPGQLDIDQIDSQIGSGYVQVNDLQLDNQAINEALLGLPVELHEGSISSATARIPWPNPLTSTIGLSLHSLKLTFHVVRPKHVPIPTTNLAESVASVADSFIHDELTPREEATLRESFHPDLASSIHSAHEQNVPGGLDPFISAPEEELFGAEADPAGISIFATLIERLLARFEFDAVNTIITLVHPDHTSLSVCIPEIVYRTEQRQDEGQPEQVEYATRVVTISGLSVTACDLRLPIHVSNTPPSASTVFTSSRRTSSPQPRSRSMSPASSSSSSLDEETQHSMSQSLAFLPPRAASPTSSVASSMYQSAVSHAEDESSARHSRTPSPNRPNDTSLHPEEHVSSSETILAFGSEPIIIKLWTPVPQRTEPPLAGVKESGAASGTINLSMEVGMIGCALRAWHIKGVLDLLDVLGASRQSQSSSTSPTSASSALALSVQLGLRGVVVLVLPSTFSGATQPRLTDFFDRPLSPPKLPHSYVRIHLETLSVSMVPVETSRSSSAADALTLSLSEISAFVFRPIPFIGSHQDVMHSASPLLITDHHLSTQYSLHPNPTENHDHPPLPHFDVSDWMDPQHGSLGMKVSHWRTKFKSKSSKLVKRGSQKEFGSPPLNYDATLGSHQATLPPAISLHAKRPASQRGSLSTQVDVEPLHFFLDIGQATSDGLLTFLDEVVNRPMSNVEDGHGETVSDDDDDEDEDTPPASPHSRRSHTSRQQDKERRRLERMVLEDLDLDLDYRRPASSKKGIPKVSKRRTRAKPQQSNTVSIKFNMIRLQIRCPPPPGRPPRSGALVLDLHDVNVSTGPVERKNVTRFAPADTNVATPVDADALFSVGFYRIVISCCPAGENKATALLLLAPLTSGSVEDPLFPNLLPRVTVSKSKSPRGASHPTSDSTTLVLIVQIPSVHIDISKQLLDSLQYLADDIAQRIERAIEGENDTDTERTDGRDPSLIGSRFFAKSRSSSSSGASTIRGDVPKSETVVKVEISEASVKIMLPRESAPARPFNINAHDIDVLVELKPEGKEETVITLAVMGLDVRNVTDSGDADSLLSLTTPRGLTSAPKPMLKLTFASLVVPETTAKESRLRVTLWGFTCNLSPEVQWATDLGLFIKPPPGAFEAVIPSERTVISLKVVDGSIRVLALHHPGALVVHVGALDFSTSIVGDSPDMSFNLSVPDLALLMIDDLGDVVDTGSHSNSGVAFWRKSGFALLVEIADLNLNCRNSRALPSPYSSVLVERIGLRLHLCADSLTAITDFAKDLISAFKPPDDEVVPKPKPAPTLISEMPSGHQGLMASVDDLAFKRVPEVGPAPDMINDDLPTNMDYLDESFGAAAGVQELRDDDLDDFDIGDSAGRDSVPVGRTQPRGIVSKVGGETIKMLRPDGLRITENYFDTLPPDTSDGSSQLGVTTTRIRVHKGDINVFLYDGYDWVKTRKTIEEEVKEMRKRLAKIKQLVARGQTPDSSFDETSTVLFNSVYIGLEQDADELEPDALIAAIDEELRDDLDTTSQSSWQSLQPSPTGALPRPRSSKIHGKRLTRSKAPSIEFRLFGVEAEVDQFHVDEPTVSRTFVTVKDLEILDHIKTSTWKKFLTELRSDSRGNVRETGSNMVRLELRSVRPVPGHPSEEARLRAKILPLRLYVDQDALDFLKKFFSFKGPQIDTNISESEPEGDIYFQLAEIFPVDLKLDYKPRRVDYRALREGKTIELMNFFHFDGAEMTLRHITLAGVTGWPRLGDMLNDLWTPDVKATQLVEVISGVAPIRSVVNVGSGVADLVLLPIAQYKKDGRIVRGVQKGTTAFFKSTAVEAIKLGARLATGTQVILEQADDVLGGQFKNPVTAETLQVPLAGDHYGQYRSNTSDDDDDEQEDLISKYAEQPVDLREGVQSAYKSLQRNFNSAAQTILAVPMEVYERSGNEGPVRSVIRAVPIAVLKPMIGASEAVSKTLLGLHSTLDPNVRHENEAKYKHR